MSKCAARARRVLAGAVAMVAVSLCNGAVASAAADLSGLPDPLVFGPQRVATTSGNGTITLTNADVDASTGLTLTIINDASNEFAIVAPIPAAVPGSGTADVLIQFTPAAAGARSADLEVTYSNGPSGSTTFTVALQGTGTTAPVLTFSTGTPHTFADTVVGATSATSNITLGNSGTETLSVTAVAQIGAGCSDFNITVPGTFDIPSDTPTLAVSFSPTARQAYSCTVRFTGNHTGSPTDYVLQGSGIGPDLAILPPPANIAFGTVHIGNSAGPTGFTIRNDGETTATVTSVAIAGAFGSQYALTGFSGGTIASLASQTINVQFNPSLPTGDKDDNVRILSDSVSGTLLFPLTGRAAQRLISTSVGSLAFGDVTVSTNSDQSFLIQNTGESSLSITGLSLTNTTDFSFVSPPTPTFVIAGGANRTITVRCSPASVGNKSGNVSITSNGDNETTTTVSLTCRGTKADISIAPAGNIDFGDQTVGTTSGAITRTVTNANLSTTETLTLSVAISGSHSSNFTVTPASCRSPSTCNIAPGGSQVVSFTFTPSALNTRNATATFNSNDLETPAVAISLTGNGTRPEINIPTGATEAFGNQRVGTSSPGRTITASNAGNENLVITNVTIIGSVPGDYSFTGPTSVSIAPGGTQSWTVTFTPTATGTRNATFSIDNNDPTGGEDPKNIPLTGQGTDANVIVTFAPPDFPETLVGFTDTINATVLNNGTASATVTNLVLNNSVFTFTAGAPALPIVLSPGASTVISLTFTPVISADISGSLTVSSDDPSSPDAFTFIGPGRIAGINVVPMAVNHGDVRIDGAADTQVVTISNGATGNLTITSITLDNATDFSFTPPFTAPVVLAPGGGSLTLNVSCLPIVAGAKTGNITIVATGVMSQVVALTCNGVIPDIAVQTPTVNFGPKDVQAIGVATENATLTNSGSDDLTITNLVFGGGAPANYALASSVSLPIVVAPSDTLNIPVEYDPAVAAVHPATLTVVSDAQGGDQEIVLDGLAIDRFIAVPTTVMLPDTQRNPESPSTANIPITNNGAALLDLFSVTKVAASDPSDAFGIVSAPDDVSGPAGNTQNAVVSFSPSAAGMFNGTIEIANDDDTNPLASLTVSGLAFVPRLGFTPLLVDFGRTGVGVPVRASETNSGRVTITNSEDFPLTIQDLRIVRTDGTIGPFTVLTPLPDEPLAPGASFEVDLEYTPTESGSVTGRFEVLVNADDIPVGMINVRGEAVTVRLRGGGCSIGADDSGGASWLVCALVLLAFGLRRRSRRAGIRAAVVALTVVAGASMLAAPARGDVSRNLDLRNFSPLPGVETQMFSVETPLIGTPNAWSMSMFFNHAMNPLTVDSPDIEGMTDSPITARTAAELAFSYAFGGKYEAGVLIPLLSQSGKQPLFSGLEPAEGTAIGDIAVHARAVLMNSKSLSLGASGTITVPTATKDQFAGADGPSTHGRAILGINSGRIRIAANLGFRVRGSSSLADVDQANELTYGAAGAYRIQNKLTGIVEVFGAKGLGGGVSEGVTPLEAVWGIRYRLTRQIGVAAGIGRGLLPGIGAPEFRMFTLISYSPQAREITPVRILPPPPVIDRGDTDSDGIINEYDKCPKEAEDKDDFEDKDGCPDPDNDKDGLPDGSDKCPLKAEDKDGYKDGDGCPDLDNDKDGIPDSKDKCANVPEDKDGFEDSDGCPEPDNDRDGIPDLLDQCATEPETINGNKDDDGCPDKGNSLVMLMPDRMEVLKPVRFRGRSARVSKRSHNVLGQVAAHLRARREFLRIRIAVHVHKRNRMDMNLSRRRAQAVRKWLVSWGIEPERLEIKAYGSSRPLMRKNTSVARSTNNRVEFILLEKKIERRK